MINCCDGLKSICDQLDCKTEETKDGVKIEIAAKDASKTKSLKALVKACQDFCGCK